MVDPSWNHRKLNVLYGAESKPDQRDVLLPHGVIANNCEFYVTAQDSSRGFVAKRYGFVSTGALQNGQRHSAFDWMTSLWHYVVFAGSFGVAYNNFVDTSNVQFVLANSATGLTYAKGGNRLYHTFFNSSGYGERQAYVLHKDSAGVFQHDALFSPPMTYTPGSPSEPGAGEVTAGLHRFGYIVEYRSGFMGRLQPDSGTGTPGVTDSFVPVEFTASGSMSLRWVLNTTWPANAVRVHVAMSPRSNPNVFILVPGASATVTAGGSSSHTINFDINDADLLALLATNDVTENRFLSTQVVAGTGPHHPSAVCEYSDRMVYFTRLADSSNNLEPAVLVSARQKYEHVTLTDHKLVTAKGTDIRTGFVLNDELFLLSPSGTYATRDNGQNPTNWPELRTVNGERGTEAVRGFAVNPEEGYAWIACRDGLYAFDGSQYGDTPISDGVAEWDLIRWDLSQQIEVKDDPTNQRVYVSVPLTGTSYDLTVFCFSYQRGKTPGKTDFSKWTIGTDFKIGGIEIVISDWAGTPNTLKKRPELCLFSGHADPRRILRQMGSVDTNPYRDYQTDSTNAAINCVWRSAPFSDDRSYQVIRHEAMHIRTFGSGTLVVKAYSLDDVRTFTLSPITLSTAPAKEILRGIDKAQDGLMIEFSNSTIDEYFTVGGIRYYWQRGVLLR